MGLQPRRCGWLKSRLGAGHEPSRESRSARLLPRPPGLGRRGRRSSAEGIALPMNLIYLHGFASGPQSSKAQYFRRRFEEIGVRMRIPDLTEGNFERLTIGGQLRVIERIAGGDDVRLMGSSMGGYLAALYAARHPEL